MTSIWLRYAFDIILIWSLRVSVAPFKWPIVRGGGRVRGRQGTSKSRRSSTKCLLWIGFLAGCKAFSKEWDFCGFSLYEKELGTLHCVLCSPSLGGADAAVFPLYTDVLILYRGLTVEVAQRGYLTAAAKPVFLICFDKSNQSNQPNQRNQRNQRNQNNQCNQRNQSNESSSFWLRFHDAFCEVYTCASI